ncbi:MAG: aspartate aminotransferase family protein [Proteobacteria bacterium]|nr:aspartate aminotransferase family protein [Pseudomonadota bacterium]
MPNAETAQTAALTKTLERALVHAKAFFEGLGERRVGSDLTADALRRTLGKPLAERGVDPGQVIDELVRDADAGLHASVGGRFYAWVLGGSLPAALAADWLVSVWDQNAGMFAVSPSSAIVEEVAGGWLKDVLRLPEHASFAFVTGCQAAHTVGLAAARWRVLNRHNWDVEKDGLFGAPSIRIFTSSECHTTVTRAARLLGMGSGCVEFIPADDQGRLPPEALREALKTHAGPKIVVLLAGDLNLGVFDDFERLVPIAREAGAWVHVDGAFGLWANASGRRRHLLKGVEACDSWATDGHKWLNVPYDSGIAFVADSEAHQAAMTSRASYMMDEGVAREQVDFNPEFSRRARGFPIYAALRELGREGLEAMIDRTSDHCAAIAAGIGALDGAEQLSVPEINQALVRFLDPKPGATEADHARHTDAVIARINADGEAFFGGVDWRGKRAMRISVSCWRTDEADVALTIEAAREALAAV